MIPKKLHYCWFGGAPKPALVEACIESWRRIMPEYEIIEWNEGRFPLRAPEIRAAVKRKAWAFVADRARLEILYREGGIYLDTDMEVIRPFDSLLDCDFFVGRESAKWISAGVIGCRPGSVIVRNLDAKWINHWKATGEYLELPKIITPELERCSSVERLVIHPSDVFYPFNPYDPNSKIKLLMYSNITERTLAIHHWMGSWHGVQRTVWRRAIRRIKSAFSSFRHR